MKLHGRQSARKGFPRELTCRDSLMAELLNCIPDGPSMFTTEYLLGQRAHGRQHNTPVMLWTFMGGAILTIGLEKDQYYIMSNDLTGHDALSLEHQLKMLDNLRLARTAFSEAKRYAGPQFDQFTLRLTCR